MKIIYAIPAALLWLWCFWLLFVLVMGLYRAYLDDRLHGLAKLMAVPALVIAYFVDWSSNWTFATLWFLELPARPGELVTDRLIRYMSQDGWRKNHARFICHNLLDYFDPRAGGHCQ
jgi:hypothetical protein